MQSFISETIDDILLTHSSLEDCVFVLPSQRSGVYIKDTIKNKIDKGFLPEIVTIEVFIEKISGISKTDTLQLLFHFYTIYCELEELPDSFEVFSSWAVIVLQDFNEIDQYLINSRAIFTYLKDVQRMKKWSVKGEFKETKLVKDHFIFMEHLGKYYNTLYSYLVEKKLGYQGLIYREATKRSSQFITKNKDKKFFFIGFNALNKSEEFLFQQFLENGNSEIYWDIDRAFYESNHSAGNFIRKYKKEWTYYEKNELKKIGDHFLDKKNIEIIGGAKNISQLKYAGEILQGLSSHENTALVLGDESLLSVSLNSIPINIDSINITMGYPLKNMPISQLISSIFQLFITQNKLQKTNANLFYHKDVSRFFKNPILFQLTNKDSRDDLLAIQMMISKENASFLSFTSICSYIDSLEKEVFSLVLSMFKPFHSVDDFMARILFFIERSRDHVSMIEKEYLYRFYNIFTQLRNLNNSGNYFQNIKSLYNFYRKIVGNEKLYFQGEPLSGLQLMGMLETRVLDFKNVIITSVNENIIPSNNRQSSFIPFDIKVAFGLPTYREKDAIYSYHFFRLLQRAKNIYLIYNTENDSFGSGEKSRFISQLELMREKVTSKLISPKILTKKKELLKIEKNKMIIDRLNELAVKGISPSTITNYLYNPIAFYKQKVLRIGELDLVQETIEANTMGTIIHDVLEDLYKPYTNKFLTQEYVQLMTEQYKDLVKKSFHKHFKNGDITTGKNRLVFEVANQFIKRFLSMEMTILKEKNQLKILGTEIPLEATISIPGIKTPITIKGIIDRVDEYNGVTRIIDYKTGMANAGDLKVLEFEEINDVKYSKAIQLLLYAYLYSRYHSLDQEKPLEAGIISFKNLNSGLLKINFSSKIKNPNHQITKDKLQEFMLQIETLLQEIYNPEIPFKEPAFLPY
ncbi:MAG: Uncharacterised protein [Flavobacterium sp. SCGC AAA160-P02]|nr:MAG: Uncharacterised protein [Flavobacterium sp. SCGC AAA160-P02]